MATDFHGPSQPDDDRLQIQAPIGPRPNVGDVEMADSDRQSHSDEPSQSLRRQSDADKPTFTPASTRTTIKKLGGMFAGTRLAKLVEQKQRDDQVERDQDVFGGTLSGGQVSENSDGRSHL